MSEAAAQLDAAPAAPVQLSAKERKAAREAARRKVMREEAERIRASRGGSAAPAAAPSDAPAPPDAPVLQLAPAAPGRTDEEMAADAAAFLSGVLFPVLAVLASWFSPWTLDLARFTDEQAREDGRAWCAVLRRYPWADRVVTWAAPFARVVQRVRALGRRKAEGAAS